MILSVVNHKGGTGKTTTTVNLGSGLAAAGKRVLLIDFDPQGSLSYSLGLADQSLTIADVLTDDCTMQEVMQQREGMDVLAANSTLADVELAMAKSEEHLSHLKNILVTLSGYEYVLIDCPPTLSLLTLNALAGSDFVIIPMQMDVLALRGLDSMLDILKKINLINKHIEVLGVLPVMVEPRKNIYQEILRHIQTHYDVRIFENVIRSSVKAAEAPSFGKSVVAHAPLSTTAMDYKKLVSEMLQIEETAYRNRHPINL